MKVNGIKIVPFNGDIYIGKEIKKLIKQFNVNTIIETGTWSAHTTREFATYGPKVITIDSTLNHLHEEFGPNSHEELKRLGIEYWVGDSSKLLGHLIKERSTLPLLFYLDAHGGGENGSNVNPILEELHQIAYPLTAVHNVIVIHDFKVPGKEFGFNGGDWGRGWEPLSYELIEPYLQRIYPQGHRYHYNSRATGATRGVIYIYPE